MVVERKTEIEIHVKARFRLVGDWRIAPKLESRERRNSFLINIVDKFIFKRPDLSLLHLTIHLLDRIVKNLEHLLSARFIRHARVALQIGQLVIVERQKAFQQVLGGYNRLLEEYHETVAVIAAQSLANFHNLLQPLLDFLGFLLQPSFSDGLVVQVLRVDLDDESVAGESVNRLVELF